MSIHNGGLDDFGPVTRSRLPPIVGTFWYVYTETLTTILNL